MFGFLAVARIRIENRIAQERRFSHELPERSREFRQAATRSSGAPRPHEVELGVSVAGWGGSETTINSALDEQKPFKFSRASVGSPSFRNDSAIPGRDVVWGSQVEGAVRRVEEHVRCFGATLPIVVI